MLKRIVHTTLVGFLSLLLVFGSTAKEFVHLFVQHHDTEHALDHVCPKGETHLEAEHHHCSFLHYVLDVFANDALVPRIIFIELFNQFDQKLIYQPDLILRAVDNSYLRGPPEYTSSQPINHRQ